MIPEVSLGTAGKPLFRWALKRLPTFIFTKYYNARNLQDDIKIRLHSARLKFAEMAGKRQVPQFQVELEAFNMSPYLDIDVQGVRSYLMGCTDEGLLDIFAQLDDWGGFDVLRGQSSPFHLTYWLNEYQTAVVSACVKLGLSMQLDVILWAESRVGVIRPFKCLKISNPHGEQTDLPAI